MVGETPSQRLQRRYGSVRRVPRGRLAPFRAAPDSFYAASVEEAGTGAMCASPRGIRFALIPLSVPRNRRNYSLYLVFTSSSLVQLRFSFIAAKEFRLS